MCTGKFGRKIGVELTSWVENKQVTAGMARESLEKSFSNVINSAKEPRPDRIGWVVLHPKSESLRPKHANKFRSELFHFLAKENGIPDPLPGTGPPLPVPIWNSPQGAPVDAFDGFPILEKYLHEIWIFPRKKMSMRDGFEWVMFRPAGGAYTPDWMVQAAIDRIRDKITKLKGANLKAAYKLDEFDLVCHYCDQALLHNTPVKGINFGFQELATNVRQALETEPKVFDKIFLFNPYEKVSVIQVA
jgi:hypothetical protein